MVKELNGSELAGFIKERQLKEVRRLKQADHVQPKLAVVATPGNTVVDTYIRLKKNYGQDIMIEVDVHYCQQEELASTIQALNHDDSVHGLILQVPISDPSQTDELINLIAPQKDVDGLRQGSPFDSATAIAINYLLAAYNVDLASKNIVIVGQGRLVGKPLTKMWQASGFSVTTIDSHTPESDRIAQLQAADVIVSAVGQPGIITSNMIPIGAIVIDAATVDDGGALVGDVELTARQRNDITITPLRGGVGPVTIAALFDGVLRAARRTTDQAQS